MDGSTESTEFCSKSRIKDVSVSMCRFSCPVCFWWKLGGSTSSERQYKTDQIRTGCWFS